MMIEKIISGGQSGVDRAALDVALELGIPCGGWCPKGRKAEDGPIPRRYPLQETLSPDYQVRTRKNVEDSDGTLVLTSGPVTGGTALAMRLARELRKACLVVDLNEAWDPKGVMEWARIHNVRVLNVAGPRESTVPGISARATEFLRITLS